MKAAITTFWIGWLASIFFVAQGRGADARWTWFDEFGRAMLPSLWAATGWSVLHAAWLTALALLAPLALAWIAAVQRSRLATILLRIAAMIVDAIPAVVLVLAAVAAMPQARWPMIAAVFSVTVFAATGNAFIAEFSRIDRLGFIESARAAGISERRIFFRYLLPNAKPLLMPVAIQVFGAAMTVVGAVGVLGLGNRSELDLGVFLLRGKEQLATRPGLMTATLFCFIFVFVLLSGLRGLAARSTAARVKPRGTAENENR